MSPRPPTAARDLGPGLSSSTRRDDQAVLGSVAVLRMSKRSFRRGSCIGVCPYICARLELALERRSPLCPYAASPLPPPPAYSSLR